MGVEHWNKWSEGDINTMMLMQTTAANLVIVPVLKLPSSYKQQLYTMDTGIGAQLGIFSFHSKAFRFVAMRQMAWHGRQMDVIKLQLPW